MICDFLSSMFSSSTDAAPDMADIGSTVINPATGLPMMGDNIGGIDVGGSPFGTDMHASSPGSGCGFGSNPWD